MQTRSTPQLHQDWIDRQAADVVAKLQSAGFTTYLVGGCVRDLLAGVHPKDFDIATDAVPQQVRKKINHSYIIGKRFRLVLVKRGNKQFEVATFRRNQPEQLNDQDETTNETKEYIDNTGVVDKTSEANLVTYHSDNTKSENKESAIIGDNYFGTPEEDAKRRDFTINALFYDPIKNELIDFIGGSQDINNKILRMIGDPDTRLVEDPIRILRAIRLAHKLKFSIEESLKFSIQKNSQYLEHSVLPRKREEYLKILRHQGASIIFCKMFDLNILKHTLTFLEPIFQNPQKADTFCYYLELFTPYTDQNPDTVLLFTCLCLAYFNAENISIEEAYQKDFAFMRQELGMFKHEIAAVYKILQLIKGLQNADYFKRKGPRRKNAFVEQEFFFFALQICKIDYLLSAQDIVFWEQIVTSTKEENII